MNGGWWSTGTIAAALAVTGCGGDSERGVEGLSGEVGRAVEAPADQRVVAVSPTGVVVTAGDDELCTHDLDGTELDCTAVDIRLQPGWNLGAWSPDGDRLVVADAQAATRLARASVNVLTLDPLGLDPIVELDADGDPIEEVVLWPSWDGDDRIRFFRSSFGEEGATELVTVAADSGDEEASVRLDDDLGLMSILDVGGRSFGEQTLVVTRGDSADVVAVDTEGGGDTVVRADTAFPTIGAISADGERAVISGTDLRSLQLGPATYLRVGESSVESEFDALAATLDPDGRLVAAIRAGGDGELSEMFDGAEIVVWDPVADDVVTIDDAPAAGYAMTWLDDDRIVLAGRESWWVLTLDD